MQKVQHQHHIKIIARSLPSKPTHF